MRGMPVAAAGRGGGNNTTRQMQERRPASLDGFTWGFDTKLGFRGVAAAVVVIRGGDAGESSEAGKQFI